MGCVANPHTCAPVVILLPALERWACSRGQTLHIQSAHLWATRDFVVRHEALGTPQKNGRGYVANLSTCGPLLILFPISCVVVAPGFILKYPTSTHGRLLPNALLFCAELRVSECAETSKTVR